MLKLIDINTFYGKIQALRDINIEVKKGQVVTILGANGAGKTTTMNTIASLIKSGSGRIEYLGKDVTNLRPDQLLRRGLALVPEGRGILGSMTVLENLEMGAYHRSDNEIEADLKTVMKRFPILEERKSQLGGTLSGGQQQMLAIGRVIMSKPDLLLLDEPSMGLAPIIVSDIFEIIKEINKEGTTVLLVEQNARQALKVADYGYVLETGRVVAQGTSEELLKDDTIKKAYLGY